LGVAQDHAQAARWFRAAAEQNHPEAQYNLAIMFARGEGVRPNQAEAYVLADRAARRGFQPAEAAREAIAKPFAPAGRAVFVEIAEQYERAAAGDAAAQTSLGHAYETGDPYEKNAALAAAWYQKAAERGQAAAQFHLGELYETGQGVAFDPTEGAFWLALSARAGYAGTEAALRRVMRGLNDAKRREVEARVGAWRPRG